MVLSSKLRRIYITGKLKDILRCAKAGNGYCAHDYERELFGAISYMSLNEEINEETYNKIYNLIILIKRRYRI